MKRTFNLVTPAVASELLTPLAALTAEPVGPFQEVGRKRSKQWFSGLQVVVASSLAVAFPVLAATNPGETDKPAVATAGTSSGTFDCSQVKALGLEKQVNIRAGLILQRCGLLAGGAPSKASVAAFAKVGRSPKSPNAYGGADVDVVLPDGASPRITQSGTAVWANGNTIVAHYADSRSSPGCYSGLSTSIDGGASWTAAQPLCAGHGTNYGLTAVVFNAKYLTWHATALASGCGGQGIGAWISNDGVAWVPFGCGHSGKEDDTYSLSVDNAPTSPFYGYMYLAYNDFTIGAEGALLVTRSIDGGATWMPPLQLSGAGFLRAASVAVSQNGDGTVIVAAMDEGGGAFNNRTNLLYRSTTGGASFTLASTGTAFYPAGRSADGSAYYVGMYSSPAGYWRHMGWGQAGVGPANVVHYVYSMGIAPLGTDPGNVMYIRSVDNGTTWSAPLQLNTDGTARAQWGASLAVSKTGRLLVTWYDERETAACGLPGANTPCYRRWGRVSQDGGVTWLPDQTVSDVVSPLPAQPDPTVGATWVGDADRSSADGEVAFTLWVDGRTLIGGSSQQDVYFEKVDLTTTPVELLGFEVE
jgi:hypothetical protein